MSMTATVRVLVGLLVLTVASPPELAAGGGCGGGGELPEPYGSSCGGGGGVLPPTAQALATGCIGTPVLWQLDDAPPEAAAVFLLGLSETAIDLGSLGLPGCSLLASSELLLLVTLTDAAGRAEFGLTLPANPNLVGLRLHSQWLVVGGDNPAGFMTTNGVRFDIID